MPNNNIYVEDPELQKIFSFLPPVDKLYTSCNFIAGIDSQGTLHFRSYAFLRSDYWKDLVMLAPDKHNFGVVFGLKSDGTCIVSKKPFAGSNSSPNVYPKTYIGNNAFGNLLSVIHSWQDIIQIAAS